MSKLFPFLVLLLLISCGTYPKENAPYSSQRQELYQAPNVLKKSLFNFKEQTISEENIQQILNSEIVLPDTLRIALLNFSSNSVSRYYEAYWNNEAYLKLQQEYITVLEKQLKQNGKVQKIIIMPSIIIGDNPNIFTLRESAVRLQADLLFIFAINSDIYHQYKVFKKNEVKAYATCESLLMDIRTGIIPHAEVVTKDFFTKKTETDLNDRELNKRAERTAVLLTLEDIGLKLSDFLK